MATSSFTALTALNKAIEHLAQHLGRDVSLRQVHTLVAIVASGPTGIDVTKLADETQSSAAAVSRNVRVLGSHHYDRTKGEGMGLISVELDPFDNRRRIAKPTNKGTLLVGEFLALIH